MIPPEGFAFRSSHVAGQGARIGLTKIDEHKAIQHIGEAAVDVEAEQAATEPGILGAIRYSTCISARTFSSREQWMGCCERR